MKMKRKRTLLSHDMGSATVDVPMSRPTALYVHVPFCSRICPYCAFTVTSRYDGELIRKYIDAIGAEIRSLGTRPLLLETVYVGGGTPSVLPDDALGRLLGTIGDACDRSRILEWTVEVNPESIDPRKARTLREAGVTRVSVGAQSMQPRFLARLGRTHEPEDVRNAVRILRDAGLANVNVDLIYGQPEQSVEQWVQDVDEVLELSVPHLSLYELTYESGTPFGRGHERGAMKRADDSVAVAMFTAALERLSRTGIEWYEVSNFARPGFESLHNQVYWRNEPYWGVGPGAFGCDRSSRTTNAADVSEWMRRVEASGRGIVEDEPLGPGETFVETLATGLRTRSGVDLARLIERTGIDPRVTHGRHIEELCGSGLAELTPERLVLTLRGVLVLDSILLGFLDRSDVAQSPAPR
jgi:oxygen-independent coproporphyrinogen-3 oxidase